MSCALASKNATTTFMIACTENTVHTPQRDLYGTSILTPRRNSPECSVMRHSYHVNGTGTNPPLIPAFHKRIFMALTHHFRQATICHSYIRAGYSHKVRHSSRAQLNGSAEFRNQTSSKFLTETGVCQVCSALSRMRSMSAPGI